MDYGVWSAPYNARFVYLLNVRSIMERSTIHFEAPFKNTGKRSLLFTSFCLLGKYYLAGSTKFCLERPGKTTLTLGDPILVKRVVFCLPKRMDWRSNSDFPHKI